MSACLHIRFRAQALQLRDRVALVHGDAHLTYGEIERSSTELANHLCGRGLAIEGRVAIVLPRSPQLIVGILGVLKAGGAYVPIDPSLPPKRIDYLLADSAPALILTSKEFAGRLGERTAQAIFLDNLQDSQESSACPQPQQLTGDHLAYLLYTSGTTGVPKGVLVCHGNVTRLFDAFQQHYPFEDGEVWSLLHSPSFDFSVWETWGALLHGGRLVLMSESTVREIADLFPLLLDQQVSLLSLTPSVFYQLAAAVSRKKLAGHSNIRTIVFGGEKLNFSALDGIARIPSKHSIAAINMYGITETTVHVTFRRLVREDVEDAARSLIGSPLADMHIHLLSAAGRKVTVGQPGEIVVSGAGLARGYWGRPHETARKFLPDAFGEYGARAYASGDIGRMHPDGDLEYLGRADDQVKIHGHRIELGEIASRLSSHHCIGDVAVYVHGQDSQRQIVAYYVSSNTEITTEELRNSVADFLPVYMIPHVFMRLERIPLNENGKVDKRSLPPPPATRARTDAEFAAPSNATEQALLDIWQKTLGISAIGVHDNFFVLGGDSIKSIQVVSAAQELGLSLSVAAVFRYGTIKGLAEYLGDTAPRRASITVEAPEPFSLLADEAVKTLPTGLVDAFPAQFVLQSLIFQSGFNDQYEIYVTSMRIRGRFCADRFAEAIERQTHINEYLRMSFMFPEDGEPIQLVHESAPLLLTVEDWRHIRPPTVDRKLQEWIDAEKKSPFEWSRAPLVRFRVHLLGDEQFQLTVSDASLDGWAVATLVTELLADYTRMLSDVRVPLCPVTTRYAEFAALERAALADKDAQEFWQGQIGQGLSCRMPRAANGRPKTDTRCRSKIQLGPDLTNKVRAFARELRVPVRSILLASHVKVLQQISKAEYVVTGLELNGRPEGRHGDRIVGSFNNIVPYKINIGRWTWRELVLQVFEHEKKIMPHRRFPYARLQKANGRKPIFDTVFVYTDFYIYDSLADLKELAVVSIDASDHTYFPLTVHFNMESRKSVVNLAADYSTDDFSEEQVRSILDNHVASLEAM